MLHANRALFSLYCVKLPHNSAKLSSEGQGTFLKLTGSGDFVCGFMKIKCLLRSCYCH